MPPQNSWEVSYIFSIYRSDINLEITKDQLNKVLSRERRNALREWAAEYYDRRWFLDHV